ncbi:MAG: hypothetical protein IKE91_02595 [Clostridia bacterium]|nr:hypothetical protein [Clostridia bacterium]
MVNELRNIIIFDYATNKRPIDEDFYRRIVDVFSKHHGLEKYVTDIEFESIPDKKSCSAYNTFRHTISVDSDVMNSYLDEICGLLPSEFTSVEKGTFKYIEAARVILHELTHAVQNKDSDADRIDEIPEKRQILAGVNPLFNANILYSVQMNGDDKAYDGLIRWKTYRDKRFGYNVVHERDAEIQSYTVAHSLIKGFDDLFPHLQKYMAINKHKAAAMGYDITDAGEVRSPLHKYAKALRKYEMIDPEYVEWFSENLDESFDTASKALPKFSDRLKHGLPISAEEYLRMKKLNHKSAHEGYIISYYAPSDDIEK